MDLDEKNASEETTQANVEYLVNFHGEVLETTKGLYAPIAIIMKLAH